MSLADRIRKGLAEPISEYEREQLREIKRIIEQRFGKDSTDDSKD